MKPYHATFLLLAVLGFSVSAVAHHSFAMFDFSRDVKISGVVAEFRFVNPHAFLYVDATDEKGNAVQWKIELAGQLNLTNSGWKSDTIKPGERLTITGKPHRSEPHFVGMPLVQRADGSVVGAEATQDNTDPLERARQERAKQRKPAP
jgi:hypothetical protein